VQQFGRRIAAVELLHGQLYAKIGWAAPGESGPFSSPR
jgi:hypothetical protein